MCFSKGATISLAPCISKKDTDMLRTREYNEDVRF